MATQQLRELGLRELDDLPGLLLGKGALLDHFGNLCNDN
jgi:hypothetical protein